LPNIQESTSMTPEELDDKAGYWTEEPAHPKWIASEELEPWDNMVCSIINQSIEDIFDPKIYGDHILCQHACDSPKYKKSIANYKRNMSIDAEEFIFSETLDFWVGSLGAPLNPEVIRKMVSEMMKERSVELDGVRGIKRKDN